MSLLLRGLLLLLVFCPASGWLKGAEPGIQASVAEMQATAQSLKWQTGSITLRNGLAKLNLTGDFRFLEHVGAEKVLHDIWGNPSDPEVLGVIFPAGLGPLDPQSWAIVVQYEEGGYVKDDDAEKINYTDLLQQMKKEVEESNQQRQKDGYAPVELVGWAAPPHYDRATHKLYWAKEVKFGDEAGNTLNYNIRVLGRHGVLVLNAISSMKQFPVIDAKMPEVISMVDFQSGNQYADFDPKVDKVAKYGIAALIAGGVGAAAFKFGLFKFLWPLLLAGKKFIIIGAVALVAAYKKVMASLRGKSATARPFTPPPSASGAHPTVRPTIDLNPPAPPVRSTQPPIGPGDRAP